MNRSLLLRLAAATALVAACGSSDGPFSSAAPEEPEAGSIVGDDDAKSKRDASAVDGSTTESRDGGPRDGHRDAGGSGDDADTRDAALPPLPDPGPYTCPTAKSSRTVGGHRAALPSITWSGAGYTMVIDEVVRETPFELQLTLEKTDAKGARIAGPLALTPQDGISRNWPRISFSGWEYGITYLEGNLRRAKFMRVSPALAKIPSSEVTLDPGTSAVAAAAVAWSNGLWGVAYSNSLGITFQRLDFSGQPLGAATSLPGHISDTGQPLVATKTGWALVSTGNAAVYEIDAQGTITNTVPLGIYAARAAIARDGNEYGVALDHTGGTFMRVSVGGGIIAGSTYDFGPTPAGNGPRAQVPDVVTPPGGGYVVTWSESIAGTPRMLRYAKVAPGGGPVVGVGFTAQNNAAFSSLAAGPCG